jgi:hypothetical protein
VRRKVAETIKRVFQDIPNIRVAVFAHGDYEDKSSTYDTKWVDFTTDEKKLCTFVKDVSATCGYDFEECYELVLRQVFDFSLLLCYAKLQTTCSRLKP